MHVGVASHHPTEVECASNSGVGGRDRLPQSQQDRGVGRKLGWKLQLSGQDQRPNGRASRLHTSTQCSIRQVGRYSRSQGL